MQLFSCIETFHKKYSPKYEVGVCCCGDYNLYPDSYLYNWIVKGGGKLSDFDGRYASGQERKPVSYQEEWRGYSNPRGFNPEKFSDTKQASIIKQLKTWNSTLNSKTEEKSNVLKHELQLKPSCTYSNYQMTTVHNGHKGGGCVDYIFYSPTLEFKAFLSIPQVKTVTHILSKSHPSDHIPLKVEFSFKIQEEKHQKSEQEQ